MDNKSIETITIAMSRKAKNKILVTIKFLNYLNYNKN